MNGPLHTFLKYQKQMRVRRCSNYFISIITFIILLSMPFTTASLYLLNQYNPSKNTFDIEIDCTQTSGTVTPFAEINSGPTPIYYVKDAVDITSQYQEIGITHVRTHDFYGPTDISTVFPDFNADPALESSYDFSNSDSCITGIINAGCQVFYRLGESASDNDSLRIPPGNFSKWAEICKHIVMHYNDGWNNGFYYNISYWEIWNEPDLDGFWDGTADEYYQLYKITVHILKGYNSSLKIGGPCTSSIENTDYTTRFLSYIVDNDLPLDFYSWHRYADTPNELYTDSTAVRSFLDTYGFTECESINTEWNINILTPQRDKDNAKNAAFTACSLTVFQDAGLDYAFRYRGTQDNNWLLRLIGFDLSLFTADGLYKRPALSYHAMNYMIQDTPLRLTTPQMDASSGITYLAGISEDKTNITLLISNYMADDTTYNLHITNILWNTSYSIIHYIIDESHHLEISEETTADTPEYTTTQTIKRNTVHFIRLTNSTAIPDEGPSVAKIPFLLRLRILDPIFRIIGILILSLIFG